MSDLLKEDGRVKGGDLTVAVTVRVTSQFGQMVAESSLRELVVGSDMACIDGGDGVMRHVDVLGDRARDAVGAQLREVLVREQA